MLDHVTDTTLRGLNAVQNVFVIPDFVKEAEATSPETARELRPDQFADPDGRLFPIQTKADTWFSVAYLTNQLTDKTAEQSIYRNRIPGIQSRLKDAVMFWGLEKSFSPVSMPDKEAAEVKPVIELQFKVGHDVKATVPVLNFTQFKEAAEELVKLRHSYPYMTRREVARQILDGREKFTDKLAEDTVDALQKTAGLQFGELSEVTRSLRERGAWYERNKSTYAVDTCKALLKESESAVGAGNALMHDAMDKVAAVVDVLDRIAGLPIDKGYTALLPAPEEIGKGMSLGQLEKLGSAMTELPDGSVVFNHRIEEKAGEIRKWFRETRGTELPEGLVTDKLAEQHPADVRILMQVLGTSVHTP